MSQVARVRVWDGFVRLFHWSLVAAFATAYTSTVGSQWVHETAGYVTIVLVIARVLWGFIGSPHARFSDFVPTPGRFWAYARAALRRREPRHIGHNPAGALMILFLLGMVSAIGVSGWMLTLDAFWGSETVETVHAVLVDVTLVAVAVHVAAALYESWNHRENLVWSMVTGRKRAPDPADGDAGAGGHAVGPSDGHGARLGGHGSRVGSGLDAATE